MLNDSEYYVIIKLISGEQLMAVLEAEDALYVKLLSPMNIRTVVDTSLGKEQITAVPLCAFTSDKNFLIEKKNVLFIKRLDPIFISHYQRIVEESERVLFSAKDKQVREPKAEDLNWEEDLDSLPTDELLRRLEMLESLVEEEKEEEEFKVFVEGNNTKH